MPGDIKSTLDDKLDHDLHFSLIKSLSNSKLSCPQFLQAGVPQGSILSLVCSIFLPLTLLLLKFATRSSCCVVINKIAELDGRGFVYDREKETVCLSLGTGLGVDKMENFA